jgi:hypothetical protein
VPNSIETVSWFVDERTICTVSCCEPFVAGCDTVVFEELL